MSFIYITGISGSGKSAVFDELIARGYDAHEGDDDLSAFYHNVTLERVDRPANVDERTPDWRAQHTWKMSRDKLEELKKNAGNKDVFICGVASNEEEYLDLFDKVFALMLDEETLKHRITNRTNNDFGKSEHELQSLLEWQQDTAEYYRKIGAHVIDARRPVQAVVDEVLENLPK